MNILFHGASVTKQDGESSYVYQLQDQLIGHKSISIQKRGYGGCHFNEAGFLTISSDVEDGTDICILEWNTTGLSKFEEDKMRFVAGFLVDKGVTPVFLILGRKDTLLIDRDCDKQVKQFCTDENILFLDYKGLIDPDTDLRDAVHTNEKGALVYAKQLKSDLLEIISKISESGHRHISYKKYRINSLRELSLDIVEGSSAVIDLVSIEKGAHVILELVIGPSSPYVEINGKSRMLFWDQWCHYERPDYKRIACDLSGTDLDHKQIVLQVLPDKIDYSSCNREFDYSGEKVLKIKGIHAVNCSMEDVKLARCA